jgi:hypothetical protein
MPDEEVSDRARLTRVVSTAHQVKIPLRNAVSFIILRPPSIVLVAKETQRIIP